MDFFWVGWSLYRRLRLDNIYLPQPGWTKVWFQVVSANSVMGLLLWQASAEISLWNNWHTLEKISVLLMLIVAAVIVYFSILWLLGVKLKFLFKTKKSK